MRIVKFVAPCLHFLLLMLVSPISSHAISPEQVFPAALNDHNTVVRFEVDSTWHLIKGSVANVGGRVWLETPTEAKSLRAEISFPVARFDTDNSGRDKKMREVMAADAFPNVIFAAQAAMGACDWTLLKSGESCEDTLLGSVQIRDVTKEISVPVTITSEQEGLSVSGTVSLQWEEFNVQDPSILIARLHKVVSVSFNCFLRTHGENKDG